MGDKLNAEQLLSECGEFFDASESISDCLARQRINPITEQILEGLK